MASKLSDVLDGHPLCLWGHPRFLIWHVQDAPFQRGRSFLCDLADLSVSHDPVKAGMSKRCCDEDQ